MPDTRTPGQIAYEVFLGARYPQPSTFRDIYSPWEEIAPEAQYAWETAAQAVLAQTAHRARAVVAHWHEFGTEHGFDEQVHALETWLEVQRLDVLPQFKQEEDTHV
jgi:hypothetical protein